MPDIFAELTWRESDQPDHRRGEPAAVAGREAADALRRLRSDGRQPARRAPGGVDGPAAVSTGRPSAHRPGRRGHRHDRRPQRQERGTQLALGRDALRANIAGMEAQLRRFLDFDCGDNSALLVNNYDWMGRFGYLEFLRDVGKHFPVNVMLAKDSVRNRLERSDAGLSYTEFSYMLLAGLRFRPSQRALRLRTSGRRQRPVGQHHRRHRSGPAAARRATLRHYGPAADPQRRRQDGQDRVGRLVALAREDQPLSLLPILDQPRRRRRGQVPAVLYRPGRRRKSARWRPSTWPIPAGGPPSGGWPPN